MVGRHGTAPCSAPKAFRAASLQCLQPDRDTKAELNRRSQVCEVLTGTGISRRGKWTERRVTLPLDLAPEASASLLGYTLKQMVEQQGSAPGIPICKTGVYLSTSIPGEMESRAGIAPASAVLQTAACAARPTG